MKIIKLSNSILFLSINPKTDTVKCRFVYFIWWFTIKRYNRDIKLDTLNMEQVLKVFESIAKDYDRQFRI